MRRIKPFQFFWHGLLILFFMGFPFLLFQQTRNPQYFANPIASVYYWIFVGSFISLFYGFTYYLIPKFFLRKKYGQFSVILVLLFAFFFLLKPFELLFGDISVRLRGKPRPPYDPFAFDILTIVVFLMIVALGLSIQITRQWRLSERRAMQAETDKVNAELSFLKAQVNPHFLFNTLNTIYSLILTQNPLAGDSVLKLSNIMRYVTDDAMADFVSLKKEVASLTDYIELQRLQQGRKVKLEFNVTGNLQDKQIAPLVLMTYIENAFKYGISNHEPAPITITLEVGEEQLHFLCRNRIFATPRVAERTGIGLQNAKKRLEFLYPGKHDLNIVTTAELYTVTLTLPVRPV